MLWVVCSSILICLVDLPSTLSPPQRSAQANLKVEVKILYERIAKSKFRKNPPGSARLVRSTVPWQNMVRSELGRLPIALFIPKYFAKDLNLTKGALRCGLDNQLVRGDGGPLSAPLASPLFGRPWQSVWSTLSAIYSALLQSTTIRVWCYADL